jgi:hypothetical protein
VGRRRTTILREMKETATRNSQCRALSALTSTACCLLVAAVASAATGREVYVAPNGSDDNPGTLEKPFATIARARDAVRPMIATMNGDITVWIRGGRYHLRESIMLDDRDGGTSRYSVIYRNYNDEEAVIIGGVPVGNWAPHERGIVKTNVGRGVEFWALLVDDRLATMARERSWHNRPPPSPRNVQAYFQKAWMSEYLKVTSLDAASRKWTLEFATSKYAGRFQYLQGSHTFIDEPGEWALDSESGTLYYLPRSPGELKNIVRPTVKSVFQVRGRSDSQQIQNVVIEGFRLLLTDFNANMRCYSGITVDGYEYSNADQLNTLRTALVTIENAHHVQVRFCDLSEAPLNAVSVYGHAMDNTVYGCRMNNLGYTGVYLAGPRIQKDTPNINMRNTVRNCLIANLTKGVNHASGVGIYQSSDNRIQNNMIHTSKRYAVSVKGVEHGKFRTVGLQDVPFEKAFEYVHSNRNIISHNYLYDLVCDSSDGGAIESWGGGRDNVVDHNIIVDAYGGGPKNGWRSHSIFIDSTSSKVWVITNNVVWNTRTRAANASCNLKGYEVLTRNNVFDISLGNHGAANFEGKGDFDFSRNIVYANSPLKSHPDGRIGPETGGNRHAFRLMKSRSGIARMDNNVYYNAQGAMTFAEARGKNSTKEHATLDAWRKATRGTSNFDTSSRAVDPQFVDASARDYRLRETSPALDMGISSIDTSSIGLLQDFPFAPASDPLRTLFVKAKGRDVYLEAQPGDVIRLRVTGRTKQWYVADLSKASIRYTVDGSRIATVSEQGVVALTGKGRVRVSAAVTLDGVTRSDDVVIYSGVVRRARQ